MQDVADRVGLSRQLVSIVLRGAPGASEASTERILAAARELGYHPNDSARMLRRRRSGQIGVLFTMRQPFEVDLVDALYHHAEARGYSLTLSSMGPARTRDTALAELMRQPLEALIVLDTGTDAELLDTLPPGIPALLLGGPTSAQPHDLVRIENETGIALAINHLIALGHERIVYLGPASSANAAERLSGYRDVMRTHGLASRVISSDFTETGGHRAAIELLPELDAELGVRVDAEAEPGIGLGAGVDAELGSASAATPVRSPTALICANDHCAIGALQTLVRAGIRVPEDMSVIGFDDSSAAALPFVRLTSVRPDPDQMAKLAIDQIHTRLENPTARPSSAAITPTLTVRGSTAAPRV